MGFSQLAHWSMLPGDTPKPVAGSDTLFFFSEIFVPPASRPPGCCGSKQSNASRAIRTITSPSLRESAALLFHAGQKSTHDQRLQTTDETASLKLLICRSRLGPRPSGVGAQFKGKSRVFRRCDGSGVAPQVKTNKGKTRSQRLRSFHLYPILLFRALGIERKRVMSAPPDVQPIAY